MDAWFVLLWDEDEEENFTDASKYFTVFLRRAQFCVLYFGPTHKHILQTCHLVTEPFMKPLSAIKIFAHIKPCTKNQTTAISTVNVIFI